MSLIRFNKMFIKRVDKISSESLIKHHFKRFIEIRNEGSKTKLKWNIWKTLTVMVLLTYLLRSQIMF